MSAARRRRQTRGWRLAPCRTSSTAKPGSSRPWICSTLMCSKKANGAPARSGLTNAERTSASEKSQQRIGHDPHPGRVVACSSRGLSPMTLPLADVQAARTVVYRTLKPSPLLVHPLLNATTGLNIFVKHENHNPTCAFKVRGGLNLIANLPPEERRGVITATTGNHGQSIALGCQREGVPCTIVVPEGNNPDKNAAMRAL